MLSEIIKNKMIARFKFYDVNSSGTLEASDYEAMVQRMTSARNLEPGSEEYRKLHDKMMNEWEELQRHADTSSDQKVTLTEWLVYCEQVIADRAIYDVVVVGQTNAIFETFDADKDGAVSVDEFIAYYDAYGKDAESARKNFATITRDAPQMTKSRLLEIMEEFHFSEDANAPGNFLWGPF